MNKHNLAIRIGLIVALVAAMIGVDNAAPDFYRTLMMGVGGWQLGSWLGNWSRARWPVTTNEEWKNYAP